MFLALLRETAGQSENNLRSLYSKVFDQRISMSQAT